MQRVWTLIPYRRYLTCCCWGSSLTKKFGYYLGTARRESLQNTAEIRRIAEMTFKCPSRSSKVASIESYFLFCSNFRRLWHRLREIWCETIEWPWNIAKVIGSVRIIWKLLCESIVSVTVDVSCIVSEILDVEMTTLYWSDVQMSLKVTKSGTNRKLVYDFLLVVHSNFCRITHRLREIWRETIKLAISVSVNVSCIICEILDVRIKAQAEITFKYHTRSSIYQSKTRIWVVISGL